MTRVTAILASIDTLIGLIIAFILIKLLRRKECDVRYRGRKRKEPDKGPEVVEEFRTGEDTSGPKIPVEFQTHTKDEWGHYRDAE